MNSDESLTWPQCTLIGQPRIGVCEVPLGLNVAPSPPDASEELGGGGASRNRVEGMVPRPTALGGEEFGHVVRNREHEATVRRNVERGLLQSDGGNAPFKQVDAVAAVPGSDEESAPKMRRHQVIW